VDVTGFVGVVLVAAQYRDANGAAHENACPSTTKRAGGGSRGVDGSRARVPGAPRLEGVAMSGMPKPNENHRRLLALAGEWVGDEKLSLSPWGPGGAAVGRTTSRPALDGFFLLQDYVEEKDGRTVFRGHGIFGWDDRQHCYVWYWFDSMGMAPPAPARGAWEGDTLTFTNEGGGQTNRYVFRFAGKDHYALLIESSRDGGATWQTLIEGDYRRVGV
jgi:hypothetical protein